MFSVPTSITDLIKTLLPKTAWGPAMAVFTVVFAIGQSIGPVLTGGSRRPHSLNASLRRQSSSCWEQASQRCASGRTRSHRLQSARRLALAGCMIRRASSRRARWRTSTTTSKGVRHDRCIRYIPLWRHFDERAVRKIAETARVRFEGMPGLRSKAFTLNSGKREAANFYVSDLEEAAKAFFTDELLERVAGLYGVRPASSSCRLPHSWKISGRDVVQG